MKLDLILVAFLDRGIFLALAVGLFLFGGKNPLVMIVNGNRKSNLCLVLTDDVFIKRFLNLYGAGKIGK